MRKAELRKLYRDKCSKISAVYRQEAAEAAASLFSQHTLFKQSEHIACYLSFKDEFDSSLIINEIWKAKKTCYVPVLSKEKENTLIFVKYEYGDALHKNKYSIFEPINTETVFPTLHLDLVILPLLAFDEQGNRLGAGGGYYDRTFAFKTQLDRTTPNLIGLAYAMQQVKSLAVDIWDVKLQGVITEKNYFTC